MIERDLYEQYRLNCNQIVKYNHFQAFYDKDDLFVIVPVSHLDDDELLEIKHMSDFLLFQKEDRLAVFVPTIKEELKSFVNGEQIVLYKLPSLNRKKYVTEGEELARFHKKGRYYPYPPKKATRLGLWKTLWENRVDQLENWWGQKIQAEPTNRFEKMFFETFPYYLGLSENAIQYVVDCVWEDERNEGKIGTICHLKYNPSSNSHYETIIFPSQLIYDHPTRDLAEWIRLKFKKGVPTQEIVRFLNDYEKILPLSPFSWRMLYGRLLFPLSYFETIEGYYSASSERVKEKYEKDFSNLLEQSEEYEQQILRQFFENVGLSVRNMQIPKIEWLGKAKY